MLRLPPERGDRRATHGSTEFSRRASSGPRWPPSRHTTYGSPSIPSGSTPIAVDTWTSDAADHPRLLTAGRARSGPPTTPSTTTSSGCIWRTSAPRTGSSVCVRSCDGRHYAPAAPASEAIDRGRRVLEDTTASTAARRTAADLIWAGNLQLLDHEQRSVVQPNFDRLSCAFARLISIGSATTFEVRGVRKEVSYFTSFYLYSLTRGSRTPCARKRSRGSPASTTVGGGWR